MFSLGCIYFVLNNITTLNNVTQRVNIFGKCGKRNGNFLM